MVLSIPVIQNVIACKWASVIFETEVNLRIEELTDATKN